MSLVMSLALDGIGTMCLSTSSGTPALPRLAAGEHSLSGRCTQAPRDQATFNCSFVAALMSQQQRKFFFWF